MEGFILFYITVCIACYVIGSFPTAFVILKKRHGKNIIEEGSGNVGAMNSFDVTGSKLTGIAVFLLDFLKGLIPVGILIFVLNFEFPFIILPAVLLVIGHNYSIFLRFKGGRGLATAAGVSVLINFWLVVIWGIGFLITYLIKKNVHWANVAATILAPIAALFFPGILMDTTYGYFPGQSDGYYTAIKELLFVFSSSISLIILLRHINPIVELLKKPKSNE